MIGHVHAGPAPTKVLGASLPASALIQWSAVSGATDYVIEYKASVASTWSTFADGVSTRRGVSISGLVDGTAYNFRVSSVVAGVVSVPSTVLNIIGGSQTLPANSVNSGVAMDDSLPQPAVRSEFHRFSYESSPFLLPPGHRNVRR